MKLVHESRASVLVFTLLLFFLQCVMTRISTLRSYENVHLLTRTWLRARYRVRDLNVYKIHMQTCEYTFVFSKFTVVTDNKSSPRTPSNLHSLESLARAMPTICPDNPPKIPLSTFLKTMKIFITYTKKKSNRQQNGTHNLTLSSI